MVKWPLLTQSEFYNIKISGWVKKKIRGKIITKIKNY